MAEPQKGSAAVSSKEKKSMLGDMDFGKDFFTSWDSMNVAGDDGMDFDFRPVAQGKKKAFSFDNLDMDFSLGGDLDKISSLKVDMPDLDISSPLKKSGTKENSTKESGDGKPQKKQDQFSFSFDFNELDAFKFEPSLTKKGNEVSKNKDSEEASNKDVCQGSRTGKREIIGPSNSLNSSSSASEGMPLSKVKITEIDIDKFDLTDHSGSLDNIADSVLKPPTNQKPVKPAELTLPEKTNNSLPQEINQDDMCQKERDFSKTNTQKFTQDFSVKSLSGDQATQVTNPEIQAEVSSRATKDPVEEETINRDSEASMELESSLSEKQEKSMAILCSDDSERNICGDNDLSIGNKNGCELTQGDLHSGDTSSSNTSRKSMSACKSSSEHQSGKSEGRVTSPNSETSKLVEIKAKETGSVRSKYFKRSDERESPFRQRQSSQTALAMFPAKLLGTKQQTDERRDVAVIKDAQGGNKLVRISDAVSKEMTKKDEEPECVRSVKGLNDIRDVDISKDVHGGNKVVRILDEVSGELTKSDGEPENVRTVRGLKNIRDSSNADGLLNGSKSSGSSRSEEKEKIIGDPVRGLEKNAKNLVALSSAIKSPSLEPILKPTPQNHATSRTVLNKVSMRSSLNISGEGNKASTPKANRSLPDLSSLKISRAIGATHGVSNSAVPKQTNSYRNLIHVREPEGSALSKISPSISIAKPSLSSPSLKRKTASEVDTQNIKPLKRFSPSPTESRNVKEILEDAKKEVRNKMNIAESYTSGGCQSSAPDIAQELNLTDLKMSLVTESDDNVEKAEAYSKELEDMCNMLKKKHDEAKELLVKAVVNNNNLLMLNHPIYEEKIRKIQNFAVQLMSEEVQA